VARDLRKCLKWKKQFPANLSGDDTLAIRVSLSQPISVVYRTLYNIIPLTPSSIYTFCLTSLAHFKLQILGLGFSFLSILENEFYRWFNQGWEGQAQGFQICFSITESRPSIPCWKNRSISQSWQIRRACWCRRSSLPLCSAWVSRSRG